MDNPKYNPKGSDKIKPTTFNLSLLIKKDKRTNIAGVTKSKNTYKIVYSFIKELYGFKNKKNIDRTIVAKGGIIESIVLILITPNHNEM
ncbi:hypothetical protein FHR92_002993 [Fontibacillus solani]|uniref:Uncharacterized protein n=1 Tax=Fontibacillus solani TaxID=1572857 RepID=A0A7W3SUR2_9BACL|nr:hypothetical protein [Fontibacillus solani]MBA9086515.1 hypothetical protein [Fontibacillus solani]